MRRLAILGLATLFFAGCDASHSYSENTSAEDVAPAIEANRGDMIFCKEINRRTTQADCDDLTETAQQAKQGTAAFNVPDMVRGKASMIQLAISLTPPPEPAPTDDAAAGGTSDAGDNMSAGAGGDMDNAMSENITADMDEPPTPSPTPHRPVTQGPTPTEIVKNLPGPTEAYSPVVGRDMRAELVGQGFEIVAKSPISQVLSPGSTTSWEWEVTPLRGTNYALSIKTAVEGVMANGDHVVLGSTVETRKVAVKVQWYDRLRDGLTDAPTWIKLVTAVLIALAALFAAWWKFVRAVKDDPEKPEKPAPTEDKPD